MATSNPIQLLISLGVNSAESRRNIQRSLDAIKNDLKLNFNINLSSQIRDSSREVDKLNAKLNNNKKSTIFSGVKQDILDGAKNVDELTKKLQASGIKYRVDFAVDQNGKRAVDKVIADVRNSIGEINRITIRPTVDKNGVASLTQVRESLTNASRVNLNDGIQKQLSSLSKLEYNLNRTTTLYNKAFDPAQAQRLNIEIQRLSNLRINNVDQLSTAQRELAKLTESYRRFRTETVDASRANDSFGDSFTKAFSKFSLWLGVSTVFYGVGRAVRNVTDRVIELDTQLTALRRVLDIPDANFNTILERSIENVDALSGRVTDYLQLVGDFGRTGLSDTQAIDLANTATLLQNISDINADQAFDSLTAAMISFGIAAEDSVRIADSLNEVNNIGLLLW